MEPNTIIRMTTLSHTHPLPMCDPLWLINYPPSPHVGVCGSF
jgi:hypothetical protein